jgi:hypothetical protein
MAVGRSAEAPDRRRRPEPPTSRSAAVAAAWSWRVADAIDAEVTGCENGKVTRTLPPEVQATVTGLPK